MVQSNRVLQASHGFGIQQVLLASQAVLVLAAHRQIGASLRCWRIGVGMLLKGLARQRFNANALDLRGRARKVPLHHVAGQSDGLENLGALVRLHGRDAHLGHHL